MNSQEFRKEINLNFLIRITNLNDDVVQLQMNYEENKPFQQKPKKEVKLVGGGQYFKHVGEELAIKHFKKVLEGGQDRYTFKLRQRRKVDFVAK